MSPAARETAVRDFAARLLAREGALVESTDDGSLYTVLPADLSGALALPGTATLRFGAEAGDGEVAVPLESAAMQWCVEQAAGRGRLAAVRLPVQASGRKAARTALNWFTALNGTLRPGDSTVGTLAVAVLEFRYEARSEERAQGSVFVAVEPGLGAVSAPLADALRRALVHAEPAAPPERPAELEALARAAEPVAREEILRRLEPYKRDRLRRLTADRERLVAYHDQLVAEASRRRRGDADTGEEALRAKVAAIARQRDEKLAELGERHAVSVRYAFSSALLVSYEATICELILRRRRREIPVRLAWDPFLRAPLPLACSGCRKPSLSFHACDAAGHLTCPECAARCSGCGRVTCRACHGPGCRACGR